MAPSGPPVRGSFVVFGLTCSSDRSYRPLREDSVGETSTRGSGRCPVQSHHAQAKAVREPKAPATRPMVLGLTYWEAMPAAALETIMTDQRSDSRVAKTRPRA